MYGVIGTAHEGKFLGQKMHSIWAPARSALAIRAHLENILGKNS